MDSFLDESFKHVHSFLNQKVFDVDMYETENDIVIEAELPGYKRDQIQLEIIDDQLRISVENSKFANEKNEKSLSYNKKQSYDKIERWILLPYPVSEKDVRATYKNDILTITTPKRRKSSRRFIDIDE